MKLPEPLQFRHVMLALVSEGQFGVMFPSSNWEVDPNRFWTLKSLASEFDGPNFGLRDFVTVVF